MVVGVQSDEEAISLYHKATKLLADASMNLREWTSNSEKLRNCLPEKDKITDRCVKVLGVPWDTVQDSIAIPPLRDKHFNVEQVTKRGVLNAIASLYDPLGLIAPVSIVGKHFF